MVDIICSILIIVLPILSAVIYPLFFYWQIKKNNPDRFYVQYPSGPRLDFDLIQDVIGRTLLLAGSIFVFSNIIIYGITGDWLLSYSYEVSRGGVVLGGIFFILFILKGLYHFTKDKSDEVVVSAKKSTDATIKPTNEKKAKVK